MYYGEGTQIKIFHFYDSDSAIGNQSRQKIEDEVNCFLSAHDGNIIKIELQGCNILIVYRS